MTLSSGGVDHLLGLKENVIIGRLIPARVDAELPSVEEQFMLGEKRSLEGPDSESFASILMKDFTEPFTNGLDDLENGHGEKVEGQPAD